MLGWLIFSEQFSFQGKHLLVVIDGRIVNIRSHNLDQFLLLDIASNCIGIL